MKKVATKRGTTRRGTRREPLTDARIVATAVAIADAEGTAALSMRTLALALGVQAMSLYNHVANKDALLARMVDVLFTAVEVPADGGWREVLRARAVAIRAALLRHPWAVGMLESRREPGATTLAHHDRTIGILRAAGVSVATIAHALAVLDAFVYGFVVQELSLPLKPAEAMSELAAEVLGTQPEGSLPNLAWFMREHVMQPGYDQAAEFDYGLELLLEGLAAREAQGTPRRSRR